MASLLANGFSQSEYSANFGVQHLQAVCQIASLLEGEDFRGFPDATLT
jgi:hypothetical protein